MAIFIPGMQCRFCCKPMESGQEITMFSPFVSNRLDPLFTFSDAVLHATCFRAHPLAEEASARYFEYQERTKPENRSCLVCSEPITNPDEYFGLGHLTQDRDQALFEFNYAQFHRACLDTWARLPAVIAGMEALVSSGILDKELGEWFQSEMGS